MATKLQPFSVGDRVIYTDPDAPRGHAMAMRGEVVAADLDSVTVTYDDYRHLPEDAHARRIVFTADAAVHALIWDPNQ